MQYFPFHDDEEMHVMTKSVVCIVPVVCIGSVVCIPSSVYRVSSVYSVYCASSVNCISTVFHQQLRVRVMPAPFSE